MNRAEAAHHGGEAEAVHDGGEAEAGTAVVEVPALVGADRITGLGIGPLPVAIAAVLTARADQQEPTVRAGVRGERDTALRTPTLAPLVGDLRTATAILDDAVRAHTPYLGRFAC